jgi:hypothetical protein
LTALELWYELGEDDAVKERPKEEEIVRRLEALRVREFVEVVTSEKNGCKPGVAGYCLKSSAAKLNRKNRSGKERI